MYYLFKRFLCPVLVNKSICVYKDNILMDTNEQAKSSDPFSLPSSDHIIPQMVITSAEDTSDEQKNITECTLVLIPPSNGIEIKEKDTSAEFAEANSASEAKHVEFEDITVVVRDVVSKCAESVSHSVSQRPLVIEVDKNTQPEETTKDSSIRCPSPPPPPPPPPSIVPHIPPPSITSSPSPVVTSSTAMQRPLVFDGTVYKAEHALETQDVIVQLPTEHKEQLICDKTYQGMQIAAETPESKKLSEECTTPTKKEGLHGVKKIFDSILHHESQEPTVCPEELESPKEPASPDIPKSEKGGIKKFFHSSKHDAIKIEKQPSSEEQSGVKESTSFTKDAKQSIKSFFDTFKHEAAVSEGKSETDISKKTTDSEKNEPSVSLENLKQSTSYTKDAKQNIKSFFDTFKHEPSEQKHSDKKSVPPFDISFSGDKELSAAPESPKEFKESTSFAKDAKQNIKAFLDTFKHESGEPKPKTSITKKAASQPDIVLEISNEQILDSHAPESPKETKESSSFVKDAKQNIKLFFTSDVKHKTTCKKSSSHSDFSKESTETDTTAKETSEISKPKESTSFAKGAKQNVKTFFDSFKHEPNASKHEDIQTKIEGDQLKENIETSKNVKLSEVSKQPTSPVKDTKQNIKTFFDNFKLTDSEADTKNKETSLKKSTISESNSPKDPVVEKVASSKDIKQNVKIFFDNFKLGDMNADAKSKDTSSKIAVSEPDLHKDSSVELGTSPTGTKQNVKAFFDNFKLGDLNSDLKNKETISKTSDVAEPVLHEFAETAVTSHKESKHPVKKFFSFKHSGESGECDNSAILDSHSSNKSSKSKPAKVVKSVKLDLDPKYSNGFENISTSFSNVNGHEIEVVSEIKERAQSVPSDPARSKNFGVLSQIKKSEISVSSLDSPEGQPVEHKGSRQSIKKFFHSFKHEKTDIEKGSLPSVTTKKGYIKELSATELSAEEEEPKATEKTAKDKKSKSIRRSLSDKVSREEVVQNFKGFFDSLSHKASSKKSLKESEHIYDVVEIKPEVDSPIPTIHIPSEDNASKSNAAKSEAQGMKKILNPSLSKDASKFGSESIHFSENKSDMKKEPSVLQKKKELELQKSSDLSYDATSSLSAAVEVSDLSPTVSEPDSPKSDKSVFDSIGENILALKERMLHTREKRKSEVIDDSVKVPDTSLKTSEIENEKSQNIAALSINNEQIRETVDKVKPVPPKKPTEMKELNKPQTSAKLGKDVKEQSSANPNSLYDTCCIKLAVLLRDKALDIVTERTKSPPPKPPKPSAEAIAKARASAVYKRIEAQKSRSLGENFPASYDGMRFADDETESSCDYKDVENFDYIMDYELINRYKIDSSKLDTFSVPSTCSGLTSYYTADTITLRDENFSDGIMETISLNSDISCNFKQFSTTSESKLSTKGEAKNKVGTAFVSKDACSVKQPTAGKKVPPPIPPKPMILQNISKIKGKADDKTLSSCVNGLSLSPRLQNKFSKDPAAIQKRPLMVADIKGTQFSSLQHPKKPPKPTRNFNTVLKNESLKTVPCVSLDSMPSTTEKVSSEDSSLQSSIKVEKRTKSPPRPPPPNIFKKPEKPPKPERPPPPLKTFKSFISDELTEDQSKKEQTETTDLVNILNEKPLKEKEIDLAISLPSENTEKTFPLPYNMHEFYGSESLVHSDECEVARTALEDTHKSDFESHQDNLNNNYQAEEDIADSLNNNIEASCSSTEKPKPPPRNRRIRSRTVEIVPTDRQEERLKRSQSLSEIDIEKRVTFLDDGKTKMDSKSLYTTVNKIGKKSSTDKTSHSSPDLVSGRPLPAPPPPPRRFRSLERKGKSKDIMNKTESEQNLCVHEQAALDQDKDIKAPARRRRTDKQRFFSLHTDRRKADLDSEIPKRAESVPAKPDRRLKRSPLAKYDVNANISSFETHQGSSSPNQNIPNAETSVTDSASNSNLKDKKDSYCRTQSHSSWYDESETLGDSWEVVDVFVHGSADEYKESPKVPIRHKSQARKKSRETSKFYINMEEAPKLPSDEKTSSLSPTDKKESLHYVDKEVSPLPLVDKETSPLPLDCSEKSVQTSLETLSQSIVSHDDQSEDTDELLDLAQTLQKELSTIINRHKSVNEDTEDTPSPPLSATTSEKNLCEDFKEMKKASSVRSSISEVWPITSSDESDVERDGEDSSNISEVSVKRKQKKIFYIAREIMTSEEAFVDALKLLNVDFKMAVDAANKQKNMAVLPDDSLAQILNHLPQLQHLNENLLMELKDRIENWDKHEKIADIIVKMGPFLKLYSWYIHDFESNVSLLEECKRKYPAFSQTVKEFEMSSRCKRLALNHYMLKPIQRIPQYRLLLQEYLHHLTEDSKDYQDTVTALQIVSEVANHANDSMKHGDNAQKLISIQNSIMGHKEIVRPGRVFIKEGELMKLSRKGMQPRWFILFNDLLLYLTSVQQGLYRVNHELPLTGMKVAIPIQQDYQNEFSIISVTRSFTLAAKSQEERQEWIIALTKAIEENASKRSTFTNSRLQQKAQDKTSSEDESAFVLGKKAPVWIPDARVTMCQLCTSEFTVTFRRHHCRACGKVICSICSSHRISLPYLGNRIARVCDECHTRLGQGSSACTESGETDSDNQQIAVKSHLRTDNRHLKKNKRVLPSVLKEVCANDQGSTISGYLHKKTGKSWKRDWFVVKDKVLYEYKASEDVAALRSVPLLGYQIESFDEAYEGVDSSLLFQLTHPGQAPIIFYADTVGSAERWVSALKTATVLE